MEGYKKINEIGRGSYGKVYRARDLKTGKIVAVKKVHITEREWASKSPCLRELSLLLGLSECPYIIKFLNYEFKKNKCYMILEYMPHNLSNYIRQFTYDQIAIQKFMYQLLKAMCYAHSNGVYHRDLKPQNILVDGITHDLKVADFSSSRQIPLPHPHTSHSPEVGTLWYRSPELLLGATGYLAAAVDMWAVGCIFAELVTKRVLFKGKDDMDQVLKIFLIMGTPNEVIWPGVTSLRRWNAYPMLPPKPMAGVVDDKLDDLGINLLSRLLDYSPDKRISAQEALDQPYFNNLDKTLYP